MRATIDGDIAMAEYYSERPEELELYLAVALEETLADGDWAAFLLALRTAAEARGGIAQLAEKTGLSRQSLYKSLSAKGNPRMETVAAILEALDMKLQIAATKPARKKARKRPAKKATTSAAKSSQGKKLAARKKTKAAAASGKHA